MICILAINGFLIFNKPLTGQTTGTIAILSSPFNLFATGISESAVTPVPKEQKPAALSKISQSDLTEPVIALPENNIIPSTRGAELIQAGYEVAEGLPLKKYEEAQVKAAMDASKKSIGKRKEWKTLEKNIAEVFTQKEKEELKATYNHEWNKIDWNTWEKQAPACL